MGIEMTINNVISEYFFDRFVQLHYHIKYTNGELVRIGFLLVIIVHIFCLLLVYRFYSFKEIHYSNF